MLLDLSAVFVFCVCVRLSCLFAWALLEEQLNAKYEAYLNCPDDSLLLEALEEIEETVAAGELV